MKSDKDLEEFKEAIMRALKEKFNKEEKKEEQTEFLVELNSVSLFIDFVHKNTKILCRLTDQNINEADSLLKHLKIQQKLFEEYMERKKHGKI